MPTNPGTHWKQRSLRVYSMCSHVATSFVVMCCSRHVPEFSALLCPVFQAMCFICVHFVSAETYCRRLSVWLFVVILIVLVRLIVFLH